MSRPAHFLSLLLLCCFAGASASCNSENDAPAALPGRWDLVSQHVTNTDATSGQVQADYTLSGKPGDYLVISTSTFEEYSAGQFSFTAPYVQTGSTISMQGPTPRMDYSRQIKEMSSKKLVLAYKLPAIVNNQAVAIEATYSR